ncbi:c2h2-like zinc finger protein [Anaeramoeba flamelloides]|uniref:C2h2-like zinc finger protein n=1 Tax=Anaeramoeba flamelloides TaxID=1746091 RepID=A0AAV7ZWK4_9EUKA|nr:c2h2-like zinc finger protein [Anaeramoeba flamelloides]
MSKKELRNEIKAKLESIEYIDEELLKYFDQGLSLKLLENSLRILQKQTNELERIKNTKKFEMVNSSKKTNLFQNSKQDLLTIQKHIGKETDQQKKFEKEIETQKKLLTNLEDQSQLLRKKKHLNTKILCALCNTPTSRRQIFLINRPDKLGENHCNHMLCRECARVELTRCVAQKQLMSCPVCMNSFVETRRLQLIEIPEKLFEDYQLIERQYLERVGKRFSIFCNNPRCRKEVQYNTDSSVQSCRYCGKIFEKDLVELMLASHKQKIEGNWPFRVFAGKKWIDAQNQKEKFKTYKLRPKSKDYRRVLAYFDESWENNEMQNIREKLNVQNVVLMMNKELTQKYNEMEQQISNHRFGVVNERMLWSASISKCEFKKKLNCKITNCSSCSIAKDGFKIPKKLKSSPLVWSDFGNGLYFHGESSQCFKPFFNTEKELKDKIRIVFFLSRVVCGREKRLKEPHQDFISIINSGFYDSIHGLKGTQLNHNSYTVYNRDLTLPVYAVLCEYRINQD